MMKAVTNLLMAFAVLAMMSTSALAGGDGGGGAKDDGTIVVANNFAGQVMAVAVGPTAPTTITEFLAQGAQFVQPGAAATFSLAAGEQTVSAIFIDDVGLVVTATDATTVTVVSGQTTNLSGDAPGVLN